MKPGEFIINGESSIDIYSTIIQDRPLIEAPKRKGEDAETTGSDGTTPMETESYHNAPLELVLFTYNEDNKYYEQRDKLHSLFDTGRWVDIVFYFDPDKTYRVMLDEGVKFENKYYYGDKQTWKVMLKVYPWKLMIDSPTKTITSAGSITNPTVRESKPTLTLKGTGNIDLKVNGKVFKLKNVPSSGIILHGETSNAYVVNNGRMVNLNEHVYTREYPRFIPGGNTISWTGNVNSIKIEPRWRSLV